MHSPFKENARRIEWMILRDSVPQRQRARVDRQIPERTPLTVTLAAAAHYPFLRAWSGFTTISCFTGGYLIFSCCWHPASPPPPLFCSFPPNLQEQITEAHVGCGTPSLLLRGGKLGPKNRSWEISFLFGAKERILPTKSVRYHLSALASAQMSHAQHFPSSSHYS